MITHAFTLTLKAQTLCLINCSYSQYELLHCLPFFFRKKQTKQLPISYFTNLKLTASFVLLTECQNLRNEAGYESVLSQFQFYHTILVICVSPLQQKLNIDNKELYGKTRIVTRRFRMPQILEFSSSLITLKFSKHNVFETRMLFKIFDIEFPYKRSYFEPFCLPAKSASETVIRPIKKMGRFLNKSNVLETGHNKLFSEC